MLEGHSKHRASFLRGQLLVELLNPRIIFAQSCWESWGSQSLTFLLTQPASHQFIQPQHEPLIRNFSPAELLTSLQKAAPPCLVFTDILALHPDLHPPLFSSHSSAFSSWPRCWQEPPSSQQVLGQCRCQAGMLCPSLLLDKL